MSNYERLTKALGQAVEQQDQYEAECLKFAGALVGAFAKQLECPEWKLYTQRSEGEPISSEDSPLDKALFWSNDTYHHFRIRLAVDRGSIVWPVRFKKPGAKFVVELYPVRAGAGRTASRHEVDGVTLEGMQDLLADWIRYAEAHFDRRLERFLNEKPGDAGLGTVGFRYDGD